MAISANVSTILNNYITAISDLKGSWEGQSYDSLVQKAEEFVGEYQVIDDQIGKLNEAVELYDRYKQAKSDLEDLKKDLDAAQSQTGLKGSEAEKQRQQVADIENNIANLEKEIENLKKQIKSALAAASKPKLEANVQQSLFGNIDFTDDANFTFFDQWNGGWGDNGSYYRLGANGEWLYDDFKTSACGPTALAMILASFGYDVNPTTIANWCTTNDLHGNGTDSSFVKKYASQNSDLHYTETGYDQNKIVDALNNGDMVVVNVYAGSALSQFDHYEVIRGYKDGKFLIADPNCGFANGWWDASTVMGSLKSGTGGSWGIGRNY